MENTVSKKRIAFLANSILTFGGEQRVLAILANGLYQYFDVTIYTEDMPETANNPYNLSNNVNVIFFKPFKVSFIIRIIRGILKLPFIKLLRNFDWTWKLTHYNKFIQKRLYTLLSSQHYDTIIALSDRLSLLLGLTKKLGLNSKIIAWEHNSFECYFRTKNDCLWKQDKLFIKAAKNFNECILLNEDYTYKYKKYLNIDSKFIYNPRSFVSEEKAQLTNKILITCCRLSVTTKGLDMLIDSFYKFAKKNTDWILHIVGEGPDRKRIEQMISEKNLQSRIKLLGYREDIKELLLNASIFVLPSRWEGFPMSLTEAYECGLPTVCFDIPATIPFRNNGSALTAKSFDTQDFADKMLLLAENYKLRIETGKKAADFAKTLSVESFINKWQTIL